MAKQIISETVNNLFLVNNGMIIRFQFPKEGIHQTQSTGR